MSAGAMDRSEEELLAIASSLTIAPGDVEK